MFEVKKSEVEAKEKILNKLRDDFKRDFPGVEFEETSESIEQLKRKKHRCNTCERYIKQVSVELIDLKFEDSKEYEAEARKNHPGLLNLPILFRLFDNPTEQLKDSKGYCVKNIPPTKGYTKTIINTPNISTCTEWNLHPNINTYFGKLSEKLIKIKEERLVKEKIEARKLKEYENAKKVIANYDSLMLKEGEVDHQPIHLKRRILKIKNQGFFVYKTN